MDPDTAPENLTITVATPDSGFLSLASNLSHPVSSFTQADVNNRRLYFTHTGACVLHPWEGISGTGNNECLGCWHWWVVHECEKRLESVM